MKYVSVALLVNCIFLFGCNAKQGFGPGEQNWGHVTVREKAHMFWWLFYTSASHFPADKPLIIWLQSLTLEFKDECGFRHMIQHVKLFLRENNCQFRNKWQKFILRLERLEMLYGFKMHKPTGDPNIFTNKGGPGASSTGIGNFQEIGPLTLNMENRKTSWTNFANILFVDNPVGTGFSYVEDLSQLAANNTQIAEDFLIFLGTFFEIHTELSNVPFYIFGQSYGGKMAVDIALSIVKSAQLRNQRTNLKGIGLGDAWISPMDSLLSWPSYLHSLGFVDKHQVEMLELATNYGKQLYDDELYRNVTNIYTVTQSLVLDYSGRVDFYNVMNQIDGQRYRAINYHESIENSLPNQADDDDNILDALMNDQVAPILGVVQKWGAQREAVFSALNTDFMKSVTDGVGRILDETDLTVTVYNGQLDLIVPTIGVENWVENLKWTYTDTWRTAIDRRVPFTVDGFVEGYEKIIDDLQFYWVNRAGHSVPSDNPKAMEYILRKMTNNFDVTKEANTEFNQHKIS